MTWCILIFISTREIPVFVILQQKHIVYSFAFDAENTNKKLIWAYGPPLITYKISLSLLRKLLLIKTLRVLDNPEYLLIRTFVKKPKGSDKRGSTVQYNTILNIIYKVAGLGNIVCASRLIVGLRVVLVLHSLSTLVFIRTI